MAEAPATTAGAEGTSDKNRNTEQFTQTHTDCHGHNYQSFLIAARGVMPLKAQECPAGRLAHFQKNWTLIKKDRWVLVLYRIPLNTPSDSKTTSATNESVPGGHNADRVVKTDSKTSSDGGHNASRGCIPLYPFISVQIGRGQHPVINLKPHNCFVQITISRWRESTT